jgi:hypothetical protein
MLRSNVIDKIAEAATLADALGADITFPQTTIAHL